jgi:hypothetical protein
MYGTAVVHAVATTYESSNKDGRRFYLKEFFQIPERGAVNGNSLCTPV